MATANVSLRADLSQLRKQLGQIPGVTEAEAKRMVSRLNKNLKKAERSSKQSWKRAKRQGPDRYAAAVGQMRALFATVIAGAGVAAFRKLSKEINETVQEVNELRKESREVGAGFEEYQRLEGAVGLLTSGHVELNKIVPKLRRNIGEAADGTAEYADMFRRLGLSAQDMMDMSLEDQFATIIDAVGQLSNRTEQSQVMMTLLGRKGAELLPIVDAGTAAFRAQAERVEAAGLVQADTAAQSEAMADATALLTQSVDVLRAEALTPLLPSLTRTTEGISDMIAQAQREGSIRDLGAAVHALTDALAPANAEATTFSDYMAGVADVTTRVVGAFEMARSLIMFLTKGMLDLGAAATRLDFSFSKSAANIESLTAGYNKLAGGVDDYRAGLADANDETDEATAATSALVDAQREASAAQRQHIRDIEAAQRDRQRQAEQAAAASKAQAEAQARALETLRGITASVYHGMESEENAILRRRDEQLAQITELAARTGEREAAIKAKHAVEMRAALEMEALEVEQAEAEAARDALRRERLEEHRRALRQAEEEARQERSKTMRVTAESGELWMSSVADLTRTVAASIRATQGDLTKEQKKQLRAMFVAEKAAGIAQAVISTAVAAAKALASAGPPANYALAAATAAAGAIQIGIIAAEPMPTFHSGASADEVQAVMRRGEAVANPVAAATPAFAEAQAIGRGEASQQGPSIIVFRQGHRTTDIQIQREMDIPESTLYQQIHGSRTRSMGHHKPGSYVS